jgi:hypothetical protein
VGICFVLLPSKNEFKNLFDQIGKVTYVIFYTIFVILFYTMMPKNIIDNYSKIINSFIIGLGIYAFYKGTSENYIEKFNINYERIKMVLLLFCFITLMITFYNINPGGFTSKYFGYSLLLTIIISVFAFLYLIIILTIPSSTQNEQNTNFLSNFSRVGSYGSIFFLLFLAFITFYIARDDSFFENKTKSSSVIILVLVISILWVLLLGTNLFDFGSAKMADVSKIDLYKNSLLMVFGLIISGLVIFWITYAISSNATTLSFALNLALVILVLGLIYKTIHVKLPQGNNRKNAFFGLLFNVLLYIPCIVGNAFDFVGKASTGGVEAGSIYMLLLAIILFIVYFKTPSLFNVVNKQGGKQLVNQPIYTDSEYTLGNYQELNGGKDSFDYQYALSCWIFIDAAPPNTSPSYVKYTSLLNFGNKPNILYNAKKNELMITMQQKDLKAITSNNLLDFDENDNRIIYRNSNVLLQKWNNIIINYNGGTLDIFLNGELVKSSIEVVPYYTFDKLTIGENDGIKGGICNVIYFSRALNSSNIYYLYNMVKKRSPPTLNESNEAILKSDLYIVGDSAKETIKN